MACEFCQRPGSSREDVFARWIAQALRTGDHGYNLTTARGRSKANTTYLGVVTRASCRDCNSGWMSRLEERVKPLLRPAMHDQPVRWDASEQEVVAAWAFKTALMYDRSSPPDRQTVPPEHFRFLYENGRPPATASITTGRYVPAEGEVEYVAWAGHAWASWTTVPSGSVAFDGYRITFNVGRLLFRLHGHVEDVGLDTSGFVKITANGEPIDALRELWPLTGKTHDWPPNWKFDTSGLRILEPPE